jgi:hypothetical protein
VSIRLAFDPSTITLTCEEILDGEVSLIGKQGPGDFPARYHPDVAKQMEAGFSESESVERLRRGAMLLGGAPDQIAAAIGQARILEDAFLAEGHEVEVVGIPRYPVQSIMAATPTSLLPIAASGCGGYLHRTRKKE